ncbi:MAG: hypothetical protein OCC45_02175 [Desulfotalea sp.]
MTELLIKIWAESWNILLDSAPYMLLGITIAGLLKIFLNANFIGKHLGKGKFTSVFKAAFLGIPLPL